MGYIVQQLASDCHAHTQMHTHIYGQAAVDNYQPQSLTYIILCKNSTTRTIQVCTFNQGLFGITPVQLVSQVVKSYSTGPHQASAGHDPAIEAF